MYLHDLGHELLYCLGPFCFAGDTPSKVQLSGSEHGIRIMIIWYRLRGISIFSYPVFTWKCEGTQSTDSGQVYDNDNFKASIMSTMPMTMTMTFMV